MSPREADIVITIDNLSKKYRIGTRHQIHDSLVHLVWSALKSPWTNWRALRSIGDVGGADESADVLWALKDINLSVRRGEVVGILGPNGAGKSTLLKVVSRITAPTVGRVCVRGRVASLLEVGTGFHPELTGRENTYLNGSVLGMTRREIAAKFDDIVAFSGVEKFIDTPVKRYSSGMRMRLAFSVAAHLDSEILIIDEVLAVGDAAFQRKCLGKISDVASNGRTILFVSHNMAAVLSLCTRGVLIEHGQVTCDGTPQEVVEKYLKSGTAHAVVPLSERVDRNGDGSVRIENVIIDDGKDGSVVSCGDPLRIRLIYRSEEPLKTPAFLIGIYDQFNRPVFFLDSSVTGGLPTELPATGAVTCITDPVNLTPGPCSLNVAVKNNGVIADHVSHVTSFSIEPDDYFGTGKLINRDTALCLIAQKWQVNVFGDQIDSRFNSI